MSGIQCLGVRNDCFAIGADFGGRTGFAGSATISCSGGRPTIPEKSRFAGGFLGTGLLMGMVITYDFQAASTYFFAASTAVSALLAPLIFPFARMAATTA